MIIFTGLLELSLRISDNISLVSGTEVGGIAYTALDHFEKSAKNKRTSEKNKCRSRH